VEDAGIDLLDDADMVIGLLEVVTILWTSLQQELNKVSGLSNSSPSDNTTYMCNVYKDYPKSPNNEHKFNLLSQIHVQ